MIKIMISLNADRLILERCISCLPVISRVGGIDGIVTWKKILSFILKTNNCNQ